MAGMKIFLRKRVLLAHLVGFLVVNVDFHVDVRKEIALPGDAHNPFQLDLVVCDLARGDAAGLFYYLN